MSIYKIEKWRTPATGYPRKRVGRAEIKSCYYQRGLYDAYGTGPPGEMGYDYYEAVKRLVVTTLKIDGKIWMVDDFPHVQAMYDHSAKLHGHVLMAGLGLGLIVHAMQDNPAITGITIIEREQDVIDLVGPLLPQRIPFEIVCADWYEYQPATPPDGVFFDLFVGDGAQLIPVALREMIQLKQRFGDIPVVVNGFSNALDKMYIAIKTAPTAQVG